MPDLVEFAKHEGIVFGVNKFTLEEIIRRRKYGEFIRFAEGIRAGKAVNGHYEFYFDLNPSKNPKLKPDGTVDYYNLDLIVITEKDELLAEYIPKVDGTEGRTVMGGFVPGKKAIDLPPLRGKGFYMSEDKRRYYAEIPGKVELVMGHLTVSDTHIIEGDVDLSTGNIDHRGDLIIRGNVKSGMIVKATGNITVDGLVESATIDAGKNLLVKGGILGGEKAVVKATGDIFALFIESATVESDSCVQADSIVNSKVVAYSDINVYGKSACIIGGNVRANRYVGTRIIGSKKGISTVIEVGIPNDCLVERKKYQDQLDEMKIELKKVETLLSKINSSENDKTEMFISTTRRKIELSAEVYRMQAIVSELDKRIKTGQDARVVAEKKVFPGAKVLIDGVRHDISDEFEKIVFFRKMEKIVSKRYEPVEEY